MADCLNNSSRENQKERYISHKAFRSVKRESSEDLCGLSCPILHDSNIIVKEIRYYRLVA